ncbi:hypothetical protein DENSPDRAFT_825791, partial [Dentipellis sp. KUC8613]
MSSAPSEPGDASMAAWMAFYNSRISPLDGISPQTSNPSVREVSRAKLDQELSSIRTITSYLGTRCNSFASINRLPPELLAHVFMYFAIAEPPSRVFHSPRSKWRGSAEGYEAYRQRSALGWVVVTYVCRSWREVALAHPALW